jgi:type IV secretion system protein VirB3
MKWGVPLVVVVGVFMPSILLAVCSIVLFKSWWVAASAAVLLPLLYLWMRWVTRRDDQRLAQMFKRMRLALINGQRAAWHERTYGSHRGRGARNVWR